jgi:hypothetical protein
MDDDIFMDDLWAEFEVPIDEGEVFYEGEEEAGVPFIEDEELPYTEEEFEDKSTEKSHKSEKKKAKEEPTDEKDSEREVIEDNNDNTEEEYIENDNRETPDFQAAKHKSEKDEEDEEKKEKKKKKQKDAPNDVKKQQSPEKTNSSTLPLIQQQQQSQVSMTGNMPIATVTATVTGENMWPPVGSQQQATQLVNYSPYNEFDGLGSIGVITSSGLSSGGFIEFYTIFVCFVLLISIFNAQR